MIQAQISDPLAEFDEYGTELHKDARVWKVYVEEADKHDTEMVNGWNESMDVILSRTVLGHINGVTQAYQRVQNKFLIESSKLLQPDPAEQSAQSLLAISQTLSAIANGTQPPGSVPPRSGDPVEFTSSRAAIWVNVLWYLSLGLSLATSFIAILAKDWCHSFMSGRSGHPYSQMCRRQRKWDMIEKWRMSELLTILPSMIHIALLLFSVGLCIYLSDTHLAVAIPIFCATGIAIAFYIWSSIAAIATDYFPYPTIISRTCRTQVAHRALQAALSLGSRVGSHPAIRNLYQMVLALTLVCVWILMLILLIFYLVFKVFKKSKSPLNRCDTYLAQSPPLVQLVAIPLSKSVRFLLWHPGNAAYGWIEQSIDILGLVVEPILSRLSGASWGIGWPEWVPKTAAQANGNEQNQDHVTSLALSWLITNCEAPQSVDIALQSIAGATSRISRQPLLDCHATLEILRRLASSNLYKGSHARTNMTISLYSRALMRLGGAPGTGQGVGESELEGLIWDMHLESVASSIVSGGFDPTPANLDALRTGSTAASNTLKLLRRDSQNTDANIGKMLSSIVNRLESHVKQSEPLHHAALLSLTNAAALILPLVPHSLTLASFGPLCIKIIEPQLNCSMPGDLLLVNLVITCMYVSSRRMDFEPGSLESQSFLQDAVGGLAECYAVERGILGMRSIFQLEMLAKHPATSRFAGLDPDARDAMLDLAASGINTLYNSSSTYRATGDKKLKEDMVRSLRVIQDPLSLVLPGPSHTFIPLLTFGPILHLWYTSVPPLRDAWRKLASNSHFPILSPAFTRVVEKSNFIFHLERMLEGGSAFERFFALGQLWLLLTTCLDTSTDSLEERKRLGAQLNKYNKSHTKSEQVRHTEIGDQLILFWSHSATFIGYPLGAWPARLMECVHQSRNSPLPEDVHDRLQNHNVPHDLRGLSSFTSWRPQSVEIETGDRLHPSNGMHALANDEKDGSNAISVQEAGGSALVGERGDTEVGGHISTSDGLRATDKVTGLENLAHDMPNAGGFIEGEGDPMAPSGQGVGNMGSRTSCLTAGTEDAENGVEVEPHISIDVHASGKVSK